MHTLSHDTCIQPRIICVSPQELLSAAHTVLSTLQHGHAGTDTTRMQGEQALRREPAHWA